MSLGSSFRRANSKVVRRSVLADIVAKAKADGKVVVFTNGCFDILHVGHIRYLEEARSLGDILVVGINSDDCVRRLKGAERPVVPEFQRMEVLAALESVDYVTLFNEDLPTDLIVEIKPSIDVKGGDYTVADMPEAEAVFAYGGEVKIIPFADTDSKGYSTSDIINRLK